MRKLEGVGILTGACEQTHGVCECSGRKYANVHVNKLFKSQHWKDTKGALQPSHLLLYCQSLVRGRAR